MTQQKNWRIARVLLGAPLLLALFSLSGCGLTRETQRVVNLARRTTFLEPRFYDYVRSDKVAQREARLYAEQAWAEIAPSLPNASPDYENGFTEGFADFLYRGGEGEPPLIPPRGYWNLRFLNKFGEATTNDWYAGFRHGAQTCKASGLREQWTVPTSLLVGQQLTGETTVQGASPMPASQSLPARQPSAMDTAPEAPLPDSRPIKDTGSDPDEDLESESHTEDVEATQTPSDADTDGLPGLTAPENPFEDEAEESPVLDSNLIPGTGADSEEAAEDDIFSLPEDAFESSDSFQPDVDGFDFDFQSSRQSTRPTKRQAKAKGPVSIKAVSPAAEIPTPILLTSGEWDDDLPPPPESLPELETMEVITSPSRTRARQRTRVKDNAVPTQTPVEELRYEPRHQTRPQLRPTQPQEVPRELPQGRPRMGRQRGQDVSQASPFRVGDAEPIATAERRRTDEPSVPMPLKAESSASTPSPVDPSLLLDLPPLQLTRTREPRPDVASSEPAVASEEPAPVVMWLDDELPPVVAAAPAPENVRIGSEEWQPFADNSQDTDPDVARYADAVLQSGGQRATPWNPQRGKEQPIRVGGSVTHEDSQSSTGAAHENRVRLAPARAVSFPSTRMTLGAQTETEEASRIEMQPPLSRSDSTPAMRVEARASEAESITNWRFPD